MTYRANPQDAMTSEVPKCSTTPGILGAKQEDPK